MNNTPVSLSPDSLKALESQKLADVKAKINDLNNTSRLASNVLNLMCANDIKIPTAYAKPVSEIQDWMTELHKAVRQQITTLESLLPKDEAAKAPELAIEAPKAVEEGKGA